MEGAEAPTRIRIPPPWGWSSLVWASGLPSGGVLAHRLVAGARHPGPLGVDAPPEATAGWVPAFVALLVIWTVVVTGVALVVAARTQHPARDLLKVWAWVLPAVLLVPSGTLYFSATPGCGSPWAGILEPFPPGTEVTVERGFGDVGGYDGTRNATVRSSSKTPAQVFDELVADYRSRGWDVTLDRDAYASAEAGHEWSLTIDVPTADSVADPNTVVVTVWHIPDDHQGCIDWD